MYSVNLNASINAVAAMNVEMGEQIVVNTSERGAPLMQVFSKTRYALTTHKMGMNRHLRLEGDRISYLETLRGQLTVQNKIFASDKNTDAIKNIDFILDQMGIKPATADERELALQIETHSSKLAATPVGFSYAPKKATHSNAKIAPPLPPRDIESDDESDAPTPPPRHRKHKL